MTDASAFDKLVVTDTLYVGARLIVNGPLKAKEVDTDKLCVGAVCVTEEQFLRMVQQSGVTQSPTTEQDTSDPTPPEIVNTPEGPPSEQRAVLPPPTDGTSSP
jgi:hypothetical protein